MRSKVGVSSIGLTPTAPIDLLDCVFVPQNGQSSGFSYSYPHPNKCPSRHSGLPSGMLRKQTTSFTELAFSCDPLEGSETVLIVLESLLCGQPLDPNSLLEAWALEQPNLVQSIRMKSSFRGELPSLVQLF